MEREDLFHVVAVAAQLTKEEELLKLIPSMPVVGEAHAHIHSAVLGITASLG